MIRTYFIAILILLLAISSGLSETPKLTFPTGLTWKEIFDAGFRPKHVPGLERKKAECLEQEVIFKFEDKPDFFLDRGRLMFELQSDDSLRVIEHVGRISISIEEAEKRLNAFHEIFSNELIQRGSTPPLVDKQRGGVAALSDYYGVAEHESYTIHYGFTGSFQADKPLLPIFMIALRHKMKGAKLPIRRHMIEPPVGYEDYSMERKIDLDRDALEERSVNLNLRNPQQRVPATLQEAEINLKERSKTPWFLGALLLLCSAIIYFWMSKKGDGAHEADSC